MVERTIFFFNLSRIDVDAISKKLKSFLNNNDLAGAEKYLETQKGIEVKIVLAGLREAPRGAESTEEAMQGAMVTEKLGLEKYLTFLGTIGNNAPFLGLFGTVTGIIKAFHALAITATPNLKTLMFGVAEALVTTAIGLIVAIPAVIANNTFRRQIKSVLTRSEAMSRLVLAQLKAENDVVLSNGPTEITKESVSATESKKSNSKKSPAKSKKDGKKQ
jgi:biopolymer transport protein ExbB/TolQ